VGVCGFLRRGLNHGWTRMNTDKNETARGGRLRFIEKKVEPRMDADGRGWTRMDTDKNEAGEGWASAFF